MYMYVYMYLYVYINDEVPISTLGEQGVNPELIYLELIRYLSR